MLGEKEDIVMTTQEACKYLRISRPTFVKYVNNGKINGAKAGKGWKVLKSELNRFLKEGNGQNLKEWKREVVHSQIKNVPAEELRI